MKHALGAIGVWIFLTGTAMAAPPEAEVQGLYEGTAGRSKVEVRVVALGSDTFKIYVREKTATGSTARGELDGKADGDAVAFKSKTGDWSARWGAGGLGGTGPGGEPFHAKRVQHKPPTMGKKPPKGAVVLLDGKDFSRLEKKGGDAGWNPGPDGSVQVPGGGMTSKQTLAGSFDMHVEFMNPFMPAARGQGRGNSGCYMPNGDEVQVLDSFGMDTYKGGGCGGLYKYKDPDVFDVFSLASLPPLEWQTYDIQYRVPQAGAGTKPHVTVLHNGIKIHDDAALNNDAKSGPLFFQDHGNPVRYRNIWIVAR